MNLYLVQHGEALAKDVDPDRPLSETGRGDVERMGRFLADKNLRIDRVVHSGKTRARQTAEILAAALAPAVPIEAGAGLDPNDPAEAFAARLTQWANDAMVVGHLPFMGRLAARLVTGTEERAVVAYRPGSIVCLERAEDGAWTIAWMLRPEVVG